jgi:type II secretory pathway component PulC
MQKTEKELEIAARRLGWTVKELKDRINEEEQIKNNMKKWNIKEEIVTDQKEETARCQQHIEKYLQLSALEEALSEDRMNVLRDLIEAALGLRNRAQEQEAAEGEGE